MFSGADGRTANRGIRGAELLLFRQLVPEGEWPEFRAILREPAIGSAEFIPGLIRLCAQQGVLRLGVAHIDGKPAAAQLWIVHNGAALIYKLAYDEQFADLSVGTILTANLMQHVLDIDKAEVVDYLSGDDAYKKDWMSDRRERWGILAMNPRTVGGAMAIGRHVGGRFLKRAAQWLSRPAKPEEAPPAVPPEQ
jgi:Acetyltransferase (GNAT) domain